MLHISTGIDNEAIYKILNHSSVKNKIKIKKLTRKPAQGLNSKLGKEGSFFLRAFLFLSLIF